MDVDSSRWKKAHVTYPKAAKLVTIIGFAVFLVAGCNSPRSTLPAWPVQPEPNFGFVFKLGICSTDQLDSFKGELTQVFVPCNISQGPTDEYLHLVSPLLTIYTRNMSQEGMQHYNHCSYMRC